MRNFRGKLKTMASSNWIVAHFFQPEGIVTKKNLSHKSFQEEKIDKGRKNYM